jgi:hypothetical protein
MNNQDGVVVVTLVYETAKEIVEKYHPYELEFFDKVWDAMELKSVDDLRDFYVCEFSVVKDSEYLSFESADSMISELVVATTAHILYGLFIQDNVNKIKEKITTTAVGKKIKIQVYDFIFNVKKLYLFSWDGIPGNDNVRLIEFLKQNFSIDWAKTAIIEKIDNGKAIKVNTEKNYLSLKLNDEKTEVNLEIDDGRTDKFVVKIEKSKLNIYKKLNF